MTFDDYWHILRREIADSDLELVLNALTKLFGDTVGEYQNQIALCHRTLQEIRFLELDGSGVVESLTQRNRVSVRLQDILETMQRDVDFVSWFDRGRLNLRLLSNDVRVSNQDFYVLRTCCIGRNHDCDLIIKNEGVSRNHARITFRDRRVWVEDLGSRNGTFINGERVVKYADLPNGSILSIADVVEFRVEIDDEIYTPQVLTLLG
jgi:hypothetical protein